MSGGDGVRYRTCYLWSAFKIDYHIVVKYWLEQTIIPDLQTTQLYNQDISNNISNPLQPQIGKGS